MSICIGVSGLLSLKVFELEVVLGIACNFRIDLTNWLFESVQPMQSALVGANLKLLIKNVASQVVQRVSKRKHLFASNRVFF